MGAKHFSNCVFQLQTLSYKAILGFHVTSQYFPNMGVRHICTPRSVKLYGNISLICVLLVYFGLFCGFGMDLSLKTEEEEIRKLSSKIPVVSEYGTALESNVKLRYLKKTSVLGIDPFIMPCEEFNPECLPPIEQSDLFGYLVLQTSYYTNHQFKNYRSLEAYNQVVSGFVASVGGKVISGKYVVAAKVRQMNDPLVNVWIITETGRFNNFSSLFRL